MAGSLIERLGVGVPILQAPMAGVSSPAMAIVLGAAGVPGAQAMIALPAEMKHISAG